MYRIRFHGRGGQGVKTASRILGTAFFLEGFEVQDAPRYGAERRGAPIFAYVRADQRPIKERGVIAHPDLVAVADDTLMTVPAAGVLQGLAAETVLVIASDVGPEAWAGRLERPARIVTVPPLPGDDPGAQPLAALACAGAAAGLCGAVGRTALTAAVERELAGLPPEALARSVGVATESYGEQEGRAGWLDEGAAARRAGREVPDWIDPPLDPADVAAPAIHTGLTSVQVRTGLWRSLRPVLERSRCHRCVWVCGSSCPDGVITADDEGYPAVDYDHCKGCLICVAQCPSHALAAVREQEAAAASGGTP